MADQAILALLLVRCYSGDKRYAMTIEQTIEIPASRRIYIDLPPQIPLGTARIAINIQECPCVDEIEAFSDEHEATEFATRLAKRTIHEAW